MWMVVCGSADVWMVMCGSADVWMVVCGSADVCGWWCVRVLMCVDGGAEATHKYQQSVLSL